MLAATCSRSDSSVMTKGHPKENFNNDSSKTISINFHPLSPGSNIYMPGAGLNYIVCQRKRDKDSPVSSSSHQHRKSRGTPRRQRHNNEGCAISAASKLEMVKSGRALFGMKHPTGGMQAVAGLPCSLTHVEKHYLKWTAQPDCSFIYSACCIANSQCQR